jgi:hypothetical protein
MGWGVFVVCRALRGAGDVRLTRLPLSAFRGPRAREG